MFKNRLVKRKWGWYLTLLDRKHFKVKLLRFNNDSWMKPQYHNYRSELWLVLSGSGAMGTKGKPDELMTANDYFHVDLQSEHSFATGYNQKALILEIQYGDKCEESDIVRL
jgi:mannose-6-phosphate isomerase-like protein (cupin superfamily)